MVYPALAEEHERPVGAFTQAGGVVRIGMPPALDILLRYPLGFLLGTRPGLRLQRIVQAVPHGMCTTQLREQLVQLSQPVGVQCEQGELV